MKQAVVDRYVDDIAYTFGVGRDALNVVRRLILIKWSDLTSLPGSSCKRLSCWILHSQEEGRLRG
jgi:hypothetical protein